MTSTEQIHVLGTWNISGMSSILSYINDYFWFISIAELQKAQKLQMLANAKNSNVKFALIKTLNLFKESLKFPFNYTTKYSV